MKTGGAAPARSAQLGFSRPRLGPIQSHAPFPPPPRSRALRRENAHALSHRPLPGARLSVRVGACVVRARARGPASGARGPESAVARRLRAPGLLGVTAAPALFQPAAEAAPGARRCRPYPRGTGCGA